MNWKPRPGEFIAGLVASAILWVIYAITATAFDDDKPSDWLGLAGAMLGTMMAIGGAVIVDRQKERREKLSSISEVMRVADEALALQRKALEQFPKETWKSKAAAKIGIEADQIYLTADRLLNRPYLTAGAIQVGAGVMTLMQTIKRGVDIFFAENGDNFGQRAFETIIVSSGLVAAIEGRSKAVREHHGL